MHSALQHLLADPRLHLARRQSQQPTRASGHARLDACLPGGGFPAGALTEILHEAPGAGELSLLLPLLARVTRGAHAAIVAPPHPPNAPALTQAGIDLRWLSIIRPGDATDALWASAQLARSGLFPAVLCWAPATGPHLRRLQLSAEEGDACLFLYRPMPAQSQASPAALRLALEPAVGGTWVSVIKCRGPAGARAFCNFGRNRPDVSPIVPPQHSANDPHALAGSTPAAAGD